MQGSVALICVRDLEHAQANVEEALNVNRKLWKANPELSGDSFARSLLTEGLVLAAARQPSSAICALGHQAEAVAIDTRLKGTANKMEAGACIAR